MSKVWLITGSGNGLGRDIAEAALAGGDSVVAGARRTEELAPLVAQNALEIPQGSLYPALYRLEHHDLITAEWGQSENNRRAKFYTLTAAGRRRLRDETAGWNRLASAIAAAMNTTPEEV